MNLKFHTKSTCIGNIDAIGVVMVYEVDAPFMYNRPHFHIINPITGKNVAICANANKYADPENHNRLSSNECVILNNWMKDFHDKEQSNWDVIYDEIYHHRADLQHNAPVTRCPDYSTINEPDPLYVNCNKYELENHVNPSLGINIDGVGRIVYYELEDERLFNRPHIHILTEDHRNVQICIHTNKYADPDSCFSLTPDEVKAFNEWAKNNKNKMCIQACWQSDDERIVSWSEDEYVVPDYSTIEEPDPIEPFYAHNSRVVDAGDCGLGRTLIFHDSNTIFSNIPHFYIQSESRMIPIGLYKSEFLDPMSPRLTKWEMEVLDAQLRMKRGLGSISLWDYMVSTWIFIHGEYARKHKMPDYTNIKVHKFKFNPSKGIYY